MKIKLTRGYFTEIDDSDYSLISMYKWHADVRRKRVYAATDVVINGKRRSMRMHTLLLDTFGKGRDFIGEHKDGNGLNNTRENLRTATHEQNMRNTGGNDGRLFRGITKQKRLVKRPWQARIHRGGVTFHLGYFATAEEAAVAYDKIASQTDGEFFRENGRARVKIETPAVEAVK